MDAHPDEERRRKFTADEVMRMVRDGILGEDERVELIEGELLVMSPQDPPHAGTVQRLIRRLARCYGDDVALRVQLPLSLSDITLPEPDVVVARGDDHAFDARHPTGTDTVLVIEVSWSSRRLDRRKAALYARGGVPVYWRIDVETRTLELHQNPEGDRYTVVQILDEHAEVEVPSTAQRWTIKDLLP